MNDTRRAAIQEEQGLVTTLTGTTVALKDLDERLSFAISRPERRKGDSKKWKDPQCESHKASVTWVPGLHSDPQQFACPCFARSHRGLGLAHFVFFPSSFDLAPSHPACIYDLSGESRFDFDESYYNLRLIHPSSSYFFPSTSVSLTSSFG